MEQYTGKTLGGRYEIQEVVGIGGMAVVYKAFDKETQKTVAVKVLKDEYLHNEEFVRRFRNESKAVAALDHKNIIKVMDVCFDDDLQYIVMEFIDGITLKTYIDNKGVLPWEEAVYFTIQILRALRHAHAKGIIHRDVKPQNIMLLENGVIKMADFGIARFSGSETKTVTDKALGSVHYISPEQAKGEKNIDARTDIYSVGVILYEMMTGKLPFDAENPVSVALMQLSNEPERPSESNSEIPIGLEEIIFKAMQKKPNNRYGSAKDMLADVLAFKKDPEIRFNYEYYVDDSPTRYIDAVDIPDEAEYHAEYAEKSAKSPVVSVLTGIVIAFLVVTAVVVIIALDINNVFDNGVGNQVMLPNFVGMNFDEVVSNPEYKFEFLKEEEFSEEIPSGQIMRQTPLGEKQVYESTVITVVVSKGKSRPMVPNIVEKTYTEGSQALLDVNLGVNRIDIYDDEMPIDYIIDISPDADIEVPSGTIIDVYVSDGPRPETMIMPDLEYLMTLDQAKPKIISMGLKIDTPTEIDSDKPEGTILSQEPKAGTEVKAGDTVKLTISNGKISPKRVKLNIDMPDGYERKLSLEILKDGVSVKVDSVLSSIVKNYEYIIEGSGESTVLVKLDGKDYIEYHVNFDKGTAEITANHSFEFQP